jgi:hypothetical protein
VVVAVGVKGLTQGRVSLVWAEARRALGFVMVVYSDCYECAPGPLWEACRWICQGCKALFC